MINFFYPAFFSLFILSVFLIEGSLKFYLFSLWALFFIVYYFYQKKNLNRVAQTPKLSFSIFLSLFIALIAIFNLFFSSHLPLSLEKVIFYLVAIAGFIFFRKLNSKLIKVSLFLYYLSLSTLVLNFFVLFFTFANPEANLFTGMNLLIRSYGHNHYAAFLLLVLPVFWWQLLFAKSESFAESKEIKILAITLLLSGYILIIFSLARLAMIIALVQLLLVFIINKKQLLRSVHSELNQALIKSFLFSFTSIIIIFFIFSLPLNQKGEQLCPLIFKQKNICEPWLQNDRLMYWQKAWWVFSKEPVFGVGFKNFGFASRQLPIAGYSQTAYAHNIFLHNLAEGGVVFGGLFIFYIIYLFTVSFRVVRGSNKPLLRLLWLAGASSFINALFDFDWHFFIIFSLTLIFLALILREIGEPAKKQTSSFSIEKLTEIFLIFLLVGTSAMSLAFFRANQLRKNDRIDTLVKYFSLVDRQIRHSMNDKKLSAENFASLEKFYRLDSDFLQNFLEIEDLDSQKRIELLFSLAKLDPLSFVNEIKFDRFSPSEVSILVDEVIKVAQKHNFINNTLFFDYWRQRNLAVEFFSVANLAYDGGDSLLAAKLYHQAMVFNPHIFSDLKPVFLEEKSLDKLSSFLASFQNFNPESMSDFLRYMDLYHRTLIFLYRENRLAEFYDLTDKILQQLPNHAWFLIHDLVNESQTLEEKARLQEVYKRYQHLEAWQSFLPLPV